ncbi:MAG: fatty acid--CoA ligase [Rhodobacteraceae bacterium]|nr:fatty acid--CoA ligase [Paracoccaceae bacterium]
MTHASPLTIGQLLRTPLANTPGQEIIHADVMRYSYAGLWQRIRRLGAALTDLGVGAGSVVAVLDWDSHRYLECFFAVPMLGAVLHTVNVRLAPEQVLYTINHAADEVILVHEDFLPLIGAIAARIIRPVRFVLLQDRPGPAATALPLAGEYEGLLAASDGAFRFPELDENTRATLFYTTGTTGDPKGVTFTHRQIVLHTLAVIAAVGPVPGMGGLHRADVYMPITPLFHVHAWGFPYVATLLGLKQVYPGRYDPERLLALIAAHGVTFSHCVPTILNMLLGARTAEATDLSRWKVIIGGAALPAGLAERALARGIDIHAAYGMSETCPLLTAADMTASIAAPDGLALRCATGKAAPLVELEIVGADMAPLPHDGIATGEVVARAPWLTAGYLNDPSGSDSLWAGGWLHTGDVGAIDPAGTLVLSDRLKDVIKSGGEWISSLHLETVVSRCDGLAETAAIGLPDAEWGERPCLLAVLRPGADRAAVEAAMRAAIDAAIGAGTLSKWARPGRIEWCDSLPKTSVGKLDKRAMRAMVAKS